MEDYLKGWREENNFLVRVFKFENFVKAVDFVNEIVPIAEEQGHHPDIEIFGYNKVKVKLTTHEEENTVTNKDMELAKMISSMIS
jgi:4a-hydroxytetrahydrobiopterin dehydratase